MVQGRVSKLSMNSLYPPFELTRVWMKIINKYHKKTTEISRATAIGACGVYVGNALGYILPPTVISGPENWDQGLETDSSEDWTEEDYELVKTQLIWMHSISFGVAAIVYISLIIIYNNEPKGAPNKFRM